MSLLKRILGIAIILIALAGVGISGAIVRFGGVALDSMVSNADSSLILATDSLKTAVDTLELTKATIGDVTLLMDSAIETADDVAVTLEDSQPLLTNATQVATVDAPASIEDVQEALPNVAEVAGAIDTTLTTLNAFQFEQSFQMPLGLPPLQFGFDLGIDYDPEVPFDATVVSIGSNLEGLPEQLRSLQTDLEQTNQNLVMLSAEIRETADNLELLNARLQDFPPLIDDYIRIVTEIDDSIRLIRRQTAAQAETGKMVLAALAIWFGLMQLAPLYLGFELLLGRRDDNNGEKEVSLTGDS